MNRFLVAALGGLLLAAPLFAAGRLGGGGGGGRAGGRPSPPARAPSYSGARPSAPRPAAPRPAAPARPSTPARPSHVPASRPAASPSRPTPRPTPTPSRPAARPAPTPSRPTPPRPTPTPSRPTPSRPTPTPSRPTPSRPTPTPSRPTGRPDLKPGGRPTTPTAPTRPAPAPGGRPDLKPAPRPTPDRPGVGTLPSRPGTRPDRPDIRPPSRPDRPGIGPDRPGIGRPDRPGIGPDRPGAGLDRPGIRPDRPGIGPDRPGIGPDRPGIRPDRPDIRPPSRPDRPGIGPDRPGIGRPDRPGIGPDRPGIGPDRPGAGLDRPGVRPDRPIVNRPEGGTINRPTVNKPVINRPTTIVNRPTNITNITHGGTTINNTINTARFTGGRYGYGGVAGYRRPWYGYHSGWYHGNWGGRWNRIPSFWLGYGFGRREAYLTAGALALGAAAIPVFYNPYYVVPEIPPTVVESPAITVVQAFDYSQPVVVPSETEEREADEDVTKYAIERYDEAREAFKKGLYSTATSLVERAIKLLPNDPTMHEFRALCLYARGKYKDAAAGMYAVLATGPGMNWDTMMTLYPDQETYTKHLRALEAFVKDNPKTGEGHFLLAYHYLVLEQREAAAEEFAAAVQANPKDELSASLYQALVAKEEDKEE